jgi:hypothetical protein
MDMLRTIAIVATLIAVLPVAPSWAASPKDKQATCKFGADSQNLQGPERAAFMKKCMSPKNDPRGPASGEAPAPKN